MISHANVHPRISARHASSTDQQRMRIQTHDSNYTLSRLSSLCSPALPAGGVGRRAASCTSPWVRKRNMNEKKKGMHRGSTLMIALRDEPAICAMNEERHGCCQQHPLHCDDTAHGGECDGVRPSNSRSVARLLGLGRAPRHKSTEPIKRRIFSPCKNQGPCKDLDLRTCAAGAEGVRGVQHFELSYFRTSNET